MEARAVFSKMELATRWGCSKQSIENMEKDGILHRLHLPGVKYSAQEVRELEGMKPEDRSPMSPFERRRLLTENAAKDKEITSLRATLQQITVLAARFMAQEAERTAEGIE